MTTYNGQKLSLKMKQTIRTRKFYSKKAIKGIANFWADDKNEIDTLCCNGGRMMSEGKTYIEVRNMCIEREFNKCIDCGLIGEPDILKQMLISEDKEYSEMGLEIIYELREKRLHGQK